MPATATGAEKVEASLGSEYRWSNKNQMDPYFGPALSIAHYVRNSDDISILEGEGEGGGEKIRKNGPCPNLF